MNCNFESYIIEIKGDRDITKENDSDNNSILNTITNTIRSSLQYQNTVDIR